MAINKRKNGLRHEELSCFAYLGKNSLGNQKEGDAETPIEDFEFTMAFGIKEYPGFKISFTKLKDMLYR